MVWSDTGSFFAMGGYAFYVWGSMGMTALALCTECFVLSRRRQAAIRLMEQKAIASEDGQQ